MNEKDVPGDTDQFHANADHFTQGAQDGGNQNNDKIIDSTDVRINPVHDTGSESSIDPAPHLTNSSASTFQMKVTKLLMLKEMNEHVQDSFKSGEINHNSVPDLHFINIRVPVVVGEYKLECCLERSCNI